MRTERGLGLIWVYVSVSTCTMMADQRSIKCYFGAPVKQLKRKAKPLAENTDENEKKKQFDGPTLVRFG